jgi:hypothetical protein
MIVTVRAACPCEDSDHGLDAGVIGSRARRCRSGGLSEPQGLAVIISAGSGLGDPRIAGITAALHERSLTLLRGRCRQLPLAGAREPEPLPRQPGSLLRVNGSPPL